MGTAYDRAAGRSHQAEAQPCLHHLRRILPDPHTTYLVHGEPDAAALRDRIDRQPGWTAVVPRSGEHALVR
ncbi:MBL fold metallo-hydrolase RNA specificity domain-containing protein [Streptomyces murinus]|uniref:MBL fold metallo-hydrolase RNA specificity domain-containing protein n=1 Tax=Streptomyces murinus TaxID=33900 RepID=UPI0037262604